MVSKKGRLHLVTHTSAYRRMWAGPGAICCCAAAVVITSTARRGTRMSALVISWQGEAQRRERRRGRRRGRRGRGGCRQGPSTQRQQGCRQGQVRDSLACYAGTLHPCRIDACQVDIDRADEKLGCPSRWYRAIIVAGRGAAAITTVGTTARTTRTGRLSARLLNAAPARLLARPGEGLVGTLHPCCHQVLK